MWSLTAEQLHPDHGEEVHEYEHHAGERAEHRQHKEERVHDLAQIFAEIVGDIRRDRERSARASSIHRASYVT